MNTLQQRALELLRAREQTEPVNQFDAQLRRQISKSGDIEFTATNAQATACKMYQWPESPA